MAARKIQVSFAGGEIGPEMHGRLDTRDYANGAARLRNMVSKPTGVAASRPGFQLVRNAFAQGAGEPVRVLDFTYTNGDTYAIELGAKAFGHYPGYIRMHRNGQTVSWGQTVLAGNQAAGNFIDSQDTIYLDDRHYLIDDEPVWLLADDPARVPAGLDTATEYFVRVVDGRRIQLLDAVGGNLVAFTVDPANDEPVFLLRDRQIAEYPSALQLTASAAVFQPTLNAVTSASPHGFADGQVVRVSGADVPLGWLTTRDYYVRTTSPNIFELMLDPGLTQVAAFTDSGSGVVTFSPILSAGDLYFDPGGTGVYYAWRSAAIASGGIAGDASLLRQTPDGVLTIGSPYRAGDLFRVTHTQSRDVMTLACNGYQIHELFRLSATSWFIGAVDLTDALGPPTTFRAASITRGKTELQLSRWYHQGGKMNLEFLTEDQFAPGDTVYLDVELFDGSAWNRWLHGYYVIASDGPASSTLTDRTRTVIIRQPDGTEVPPPPGSPGPFPARGTAFYTDLGAQRENVYKVTSVDIDQIESVASAEFMVDNTLDVPGASNTLKWAHVPGADAYRIYKQSFSGLFGFIGEAEDTGSGDQEFEDDSIDPDQTATPPVWDHRITPTIDPQAVAYFEQRRVFGGATAYPERLWLTRTATESDFTYTIPIRDDDRIDLELRALVAQGIRHVVPLGELLVLTSSGEWKITSTNSAAVTPSTISVRQQSSNGTTYVQPVVSNDVILYAAARGGHLRELGFRWQSQSFGGDDLSLRAHHLFEDYQIVDMAEMRSPISLVWIVSSSGKLVGLTYIPGEEVRGFHQHDTEGQFESVCVCPEAAEDSVYVVVDRSKGAQRWRTIERMRIRPKVPPAYFAGSDAFLTTYESSYVSAFSGLYGYARFSLVPSRSVGTAVELTCSDELGNPSPGFALDDEDEQIVVRRVDGEGGEYRMEVEEFLDAETLRCKLSTTLPKELVGADLIWAIARRRYRMPAEFEGREVAVSANGEPHHLVVQNGYVSLPAPSLRVTVGLPYTPELHTLPLSLQVEGAAQGRMKAINRAWLRLYESRRGVVIGPTDDDMVPVEQLEAQPSGEEGVYRTTLLPAWTEDGRVAIRQTEPLPMTVLSLVVLAEFGG